MLRTRMLGVAVVVASTFLLPVGIPDAAAAAPTVAAPSLATSGAYTPVTPYRVCDTRPPGGAIAPNQCNDNSTGAGSGPITNGATRVITIDHFGPVPPSGVTAVVVNVTAVDPTKNTYLSVNPDGVTTHPGTSNLNPNAGTVLANLVEVGVSTAGKIDVYNNVGTTNVIVDVEGYVDSSPAGLYTPATTPARICDTRASGNGVIANPCDAHGLSPIGSGQTLTFPVNAIGSPVPASRERRGLQPHGDQSDRPHRADGIRRQQFEAERVESQHRRACRPPQPRHRAGDLRQRHLHGLGLEQRRVGEHRSRRRRLVHDGVGRTVHRALNAGARL